MQHFIDFLMEFDRFLAGPPAGDGDFLRSPPTLAKLLSGGSLGVTEMLFCRQREMKYHLRAWWAKWIHFNIFDSF
jgi:hypothetical protein